MSPDFLKAIKHAIIQNWHTIDTLGLERFEGEGHSGNTCNRVLTTEKGNEMNCAVVAQHVPAATINGAGG